MLLAQLNVGIPTGPLDGARMADFMADLEPVNATADAAPGFVWRLQDEAGDATSIRPFDDERVLVNMSAWESVEALAAWVYSGEHRAIMTRRREFFVPMREAFQVLWWSDGIPTLGEAVLRLEHLREHGPTARAFTFRQPFPDPRADADAPAAVGDDWLCPA